MRLPCGNSSKCRMTLECSGDLADTGRPMAGEYIVTRIDKANVVEFRVASLMDALVLEEIGVNLNKMVDEEDRRIMILDFARVEYMSSQAIGLVIALHRKLS